MNKPRMIIIEGPDCVGKTTLANKLADHFNMKYKHMGAPPEGEVQLDHYIQHIEDNTVWDRFHVGSIVYGNNLEISTPIPRNDYRTLNKILKLYGAVMLVILSTKQVLTRNYSDFEQRDSLPEVLDANHHFERLCRQDNFDGLRTGVYKIENENDYPELEGEGGILEWLNKLN